MVKLFKLIPILALVGGIGIALANQGMENPCVQEYTQGYVKTDPDTGLDPTLIPEDEIRSGNMLDAGEYLVDFECNTSNDECYWIYSPGHDEANEEGWIECKGTHEEL